MKKAVVCLLLALLLVVLCESHVRSFLLESASLLFRGREQSGEAAPETEFDSHVSAAPASDMLEVTLYFRFGQTGVLGAERVELDIRRDETVAKMIVQALIDGPQVSYAKLEGVFPPGTEVISVTGEGTTAFVTLNRSFLGRPDGAPADWEDHESWRVEAALRRSLAMQSMVLALTEDGRYQRVQLYVADSDDDVPERVPLYYFDGSVLDFSVVLGACGRDEAAMLTPGRAMNMILDAWQRRDWAALYPLVCAPEGEQMPTLSVFEAQMQRLDVSLLTYDTSEGTVSFDGQRATIVVNAQIRSQEGGDAQIVRQSVPLVRSMDNWAISTAALEALMIRD